MHKQMKDPVDIEIGKKVKGYRLIAGFNDQDKFAQEIEMPLSTYRLKEQGKTGFLVRELIRISSILKRLITDLLP